MPANGLSGKTVVTDTLPILNGGYGDFWYDSLDGQKVQVKNPAVDTYKEGSLSINNSEEDEYEIISSNPKCVIISFNNGLKGTNKKRTIEITLTTNVNQDWLKAVANNQFHVDAHENKVTLQLASGKKYEDNATAYPSSPTIRKNYGGKIEEKDGLPIYKFNVMIGGVSEKEFEVKDEFPEYLKYFTDNKREAKVFGGSTYDQQTDNIGKVQVQKDSTNSVIFHVSLNDDAQKYSYYKIEYYLSVKDLEALHKLQQEALNAENNTCSLTNTASFKDATA